MNNYDRLREILDAHPATAPKAKSIDDILRVLFTPEEAALAVHMSFKYKSVPKIAGAAGVAEDAAKKIWSRWQTRESFIPGTKRVKNSMACSH